MSVSSSSWGLGRAAVCDCGTPWTFLLPFCKTSHFRCNYSIVVTLFMAAYFTYFFHIVKLALWPSFLTAFDFAFCFLSVCIIVLFGAASGGKGDVSCE